MRFSQPPSFHLRQNREAHYGVLQQAFLCLLPHLDGGLLLLPLLHLSPFSTLGHGLLTHLVLTQPHLSVVTTALSQLGQLGVFGGTQFFGLQV